MSVVVMRGIVKEYPLVTAVNRVDFELAKGEIHCLLGENGAGKTTLMKILYGMTSFNEGVIEVQGASVRFKSPSDAIRNGIGMVHQHFQLTPVLSVAENVVVGDERQGKFHFDKRKAVEQVDALIQEYGFKINAADKVETLSVGEQQRVEIVKALYRNASILILDEPTAVLTPQEVEELFRVMRKMREMGKTVIIITHKLKEAVEISDRVSVMRDGVMIRSGIATKDCTVSSLAEMMVGRELNLESTRRAKQFGDVVFEVKNLNLSDRSGEVLKNIGLSIRAGEIFGIAGVEGNGQTELIEVLTGIRKADAMELTLNKRPVGGKVKHFLDAGVGHVPEDRLTRGLIKDMSIRENLILGYHRTPRFSGRFFLRSAEVTKFAKQVMEDYHIKAPNERVYIESLSGGNQQKVVIGRVFSEDPRVIIVAQPTRGVDVGATEYIHDVLLDLRDKGAAIILISADLDEVLRLSDTLAVLYEGELVTKVPADALSETEVGMMMLSGKTKGGETDENSGV